MNTLFEQLGGAPAVDMAVDRFYDKVLADERIRHFFTGVDMARFPGHGVDQRQVQRCRSRSCRAASAMA